MTILDHKIEATEIKQFKKMLDRLDETTEEEIARLNERWFRIYCYTMGRVLLTVLKELDEKSCVQSEGYGVEPTIKPNRLRNLVGVVEWKNLLLHVS